MNFQKFVYGLLSAAFLTGAAHAQNVIRNSTFDTDTLPWTTDPTVTWSNRQDHDDEAVGAGGSLQFSTSMIAKASQCVNVSPNTTYTLSLWYGLDPQSDFAPCSNPKVIPSLAYWSGSDCTGNGQGGLAGFQLTPTTSWANHSATITMSPGVNSAAVKLEVSCGAQNGVAIVYFDDVTLTKEEIFGDGFDSELLH